MGLGAWYGRTFALAGAMSALVPALVMWGFTVDDALIPLRYAHHLASGLGYRFDVHGPVTDGVTPLPWVPLLVPLATGDLVVALERVKVVGVVVWALAGLGLGRFLARRAAGDRRATVHAAVALAVLAVAFPVGAWAASGMETGFATAFATLAAVSFERPKRAAALAGVVACFRPELVVWALALAGGAAAAGYDPERRTELGRARAVIVASALALGPFVICALVRLVVFGRVAPLALLAKPSDLSHGVAYAAAATVVVLTPILAAAPIAWWRAAPIAKVLALALVVHVIVVIAVGGDWMPYARLMVPVAPGLAIVHVEVARVANVFASSARAIAALALGIALFVTGAPPGRHVLRDRKDLIASARPMFAGSRVVAALDVGWVGAATEADIVDLAGLTDPAIASLPGGHTSKPVDVAMLLERDVDTVVVYSATRIVEGRITRAELFSRRFESVGEVPLGRQGAFYTFYRRR
jgi:hypothetical protein